MLKNNFSNNIWDITADANETSAVGPYFELITGKSKYGNKAGEFYQNNNMNHVT